MIDWKRDISKNSCWRGEVFIDDMKFNLTIQSFMFGIGSTYSIKFWAESDHLKSTLNIENKTAHCFGEIKPLIDSIKQTAEQKFKETIFKHWKEND